jgi:hypothetical protein
MTRTKRTAPAQESEAHTETIERHYFGALHRLAQERSAQNRDPDYSPFERPESDPTPPPLTSPEKAAIDNAVRSFITSNPTAPGTIDSSTKRIDSNVDRAMIYHVFLTLARALMGGFRVCRKRGRSRPARPRPPQLWWPRLHRYLR